ncbi:nitrate reductase cytochrome c-type subunit [Aquimarina sediminis]|uniref:nitrate reductase cytochrome c-type subunit n=1 Tax=Aquimarina sediminis TaxID=2070536 RepID=UPI000CA05AE1|nr:nitrate reductase cytochrome c-type subunit [Aquimarina sediminis]
MKKRLGIISLFTILFLAFITIWNYSYQTGLKEAYIPIENENENILIPSEDGVFRRSEFALEYANMPIDEEHQRSLDTYYDNRAYHGAPPSIPHPVKQEMSMGGNTCLQCHQNGGFVTKFNAYAPVTPHPEMINCRQCHVAQNSETFFAETGFAKNQAPKVGVNNALPGSPPVIPHQIQMRENCLSCHAGPAAPKEIRVTHPERINCRQCHIPSDKEVANIEVFTRANTNDNE